MGRRLAFVPFLFTACLLGGCFETEETQALSFDLDGDGVADALPENRGGPWFECDEARERAAAGDVCAFEGTCGAVVPEDHAVGETVACLDHRVVLTRHSWTPEPASSCVVGAEVSGACVDVSPLGCDAENTFRSTLCVGYEDDPPHDGVPGAAWALVDEASCQRLRDEAAENGDPCQGAYVCAGQWPAGEPAAFWDAVAWCDGGSLRIVIRPPGH